MRIGLKCKNGFVVLTAVLIFLIVFSRMLCLSHEMNNHPDEGVFVHSATSMANVLLGVESEYSEVKPYPQGSYFFYAPFQIIFKLININASTRLANRIGALFYYTIGCITGLRIVQHFFKKDRLSALLYILLCVFSIFHIEQSRYGTGDPISFALLILSVYSSAQFLKAKANSARGYIYISFCLVGFAAAVKYPLVYFVLIPLASLILGEGNQWKKCVLRIVIGLMIMACSFLLLSPGVVGDFGYLNKVINREMDAYIYSGNTTEIGGLRNHILSVFFYWFLYSDILFSPVFFFLAIRKIHNSVCKKKSSVTIYFAYVLPAILLIFLVYNLFVTTLFMRTLYPFFALVLPFVAYGISIVWKQKKLLAVLLTCFLVFRGCMMITALMPYSHQEHLEECIQHAVEISDGKRIIGLGLDTYYTGKNGQQPLQILDEIEHIPLAQLEENGFPAFKSGDVIITGSLEFGKASPYLLAISNPTINQLIYGWQSFKSTYQDYYIGQSYPQTYGYMFGLWIKGTNLSEYDFPMNYIYAIP